MFRIVSEGQILDAGPGVALVGTETALVGGGKFARFQASYARPTRVELGVGGPVAILDHLMMARLLTFALVAMAVLWRWLRD